MKIPNKNDVLAANKMTVPDEAKRIIAAIIEDGRINKFCGTPIMYTFTLNKELAEDVINAVRDSFIDEGWRMSYCENYEEQCDDEFKSVWDIELC